MKALSASIVVLAGCIVLAAGAHVRHGDTQAVISAIGCGVGACGLLGWWRALGKAA